MAKITFKSLRCIEQEDRAPDGDEIRLETLGGDHQTVVVWKGKMKRGDYKEVGETGDLAKVTRITLIDEDFPDADDVLGHWNAPYRSTDGREAIHSFTEKGAHYELTYSIE